ncbi:MAG: class I SAM-dependent methyltransferase [Anaerolineae bacterium]|nr:class I SAM-dependent methyltransferase [Phycisphaerae bacterium]
MSSNERFNPMDYPLAMSWPKRLTRGSGWVAHTPFAMALVDMCRPDRIVELGTLSGDSYCAMCQAVEILKLPTRCTAIDNWEGDPHNGMYGPDVLKELRDHHDVQYSSFSNLLQMTFDSAAPQFKEGSIDLLHIDGFHTYDAVKGDYENWLPKLSARGVVLFHDTQMRHKDFGVWKLWEEVSAKYPNFEFHHSAGLGVLAVGAEAPPAVLKFLETARREPDAVRTYFKHVGDVVETSRLALTMIDNVQRLQTLLDQRKHVIGETVHQSLPGEPFTAPLRYMERMMNDVQALTLADLKQRGVQVRVVPPQQ